MTATIFSPMLDLCRRGDCTRKCIQCKPTEDTEVLEELVVMVMESKQELSTGATVQVKGDELPG